MFVYSLLYRPSLNTLWNLVKKLDAVVFYSVTLRSTDCLLSSTMWSAGNRIWDLSIERPMPYPLHCYCGDSIHGCQYRYQVNAKPLKYSNLLQFWCNEQAFQSRGLVFEYRWMAVLPGRSSNQEGHPTSVFTRHNSIDVCRPIPLQKKTSPKILQDIKTWDCKWTWVSLFLFWGLLTVSE